MKKKSNKELEQDFKKMKKPSQDKFDPARKNKKYHEKMFYSEKSLDF